MASAPLLIKKYSNRRLYDTEESQYITLDQLEARVRNGVDVRVMDAQTGDDLTQTTLMQIIIEGRGAARLLPVPLLLQLIRMGDDALAEFLSRYMALALKAYQHARTGLQTVAPYNPFAAVPIQASNALARMLLAAPWIDTEPPFPVPTAQSAHPPPPPGSGPPPLPPAGPAPQNAELAELRRELDELKRAVKRRKTR
jgi:polyhydroxyalkanoate synthesis repressor PhaR